MGLFCKLTVCFEFCVRCILCRGRRMRGMIRVSGGKDGVVGRGVSFVLLSFL